MNDVSKASSTGVYCLLHSPLCPGTQAREHTHRKSSANARPGLYEDTHTHTSPQQPYYKAVSYPSSPEFVPERSAVQVYKRNRNWDAGVIFSDGKRQAGKAGWEEVPGTTRQKAMGGGVVFESNWPVPKF